MLNPGAGIPFDRCFAITHGQSTFDFDHPQWVQRRNFLVLAYCPRLSALESRYHHNEDLLVLHRKGQEVCRVNLRNPSDRALLNEFFDQFISDYQPGPYRIAEVSDRNLTDSPQQGVSVMNLASLRALEQAAGSALDMRRFRGNLWFDGSQPWQEFNWINRELIIGKARLKVIKRIERCAAINANPDTGERDRNILKTLHSSFRHTDFGVLAEVTAGGAIAVVDPILLS
jgi:uncharacterized protein YcbX